MSGRRERIPVLQLAPWVDLGGTDKGTIDWFRWMDRERFALSLLTTQPSPNRCLAEVVPFAQEVWALPDLMSGDGMARFVLDFIASRGIRVVHLMNSRLGFELLPDIYALAERPRIVVQLHVEEPERNGYVRYVATRFGNLVDAFSVSTPDLADALVGYGIRRDRIRVILTGIEAEEEFSPARVTPVEGLDPGVRHILFAARLVEQKDPLLLVEIVAALRARRPGFQLHVVGEGELEDDLRQAIAAHGLEPWIRLHPACPGLHRWYAACDVLLMTSRFEGIPYVAYEAMAMGLCAVVPALPGTLALLAPGTGYAIDPRNDVEGYVSALERLLADGEHAAQMGARAREHMRTRFPVTGMADAHAELYEDLLDVAPRPAPPAPAPAPANGTVPLRFRTRPSRGTPRVSVVLPCFNQGDWLLECVESLRAQTYPELEVIVVDDASTEPATLAAIGLLERAADVQVLVQARNSGPSAARNRGIRAASGRYVLPVDSDNLLLPRAVAALVAQLQAAGERIGFVYPNVQYFGNREDYFEAPDHNVNTLMRLNYSDTSALIDRDVFDAGLWFPEAVVDGHEDWHFFLALAERDVHGEPARGKTLLYRKHGFNRSDRIDHGGDHTEEAFAACHGALAGPSIKARFSPALSLVALEPLRATSIGSMQFQARLSAQSCLDFEVLTVTDREIAIVAPPAARWLPARPGAAPSELLQEGVRRARGRWILATRGTAADALPNRALVEQLVRMFLADPGLRAVAFADAGGHDLRPLSDAEADGTSVHALAWAVPAEAQRLDGLRLRDGDELGSVAREFLLAGDQVEWRQLPAPATPATRSATGGPPALRLDDVTDAHARSERELRFATHPMLPAALPQPHPRLRPDEPWRPVLALPLCRHRARVGEGRVLNTSIEPVPGYELERVLGLLRSQSLAGTVRLALAPGGGVEVCQRGEALDADAQRRTLGYAEEVHFNGLDPLVRGRHANSGQTLLVCGADDPLWAVLAEPIAGVGYVERVPINPPERAHGAMRPRLLGLVRAADFEARRHRYAVGRVPPGRCVWELGALLSEPVEGAVPLELVDDRVVASSLRGPRPLSAVGATARWALSPLGWSDLGQAAARRRATLRRLASAPALLLRPPAPPSPTGTPAGWLLARASAGRIPLYAAVHPATGDQLLTRYRVEATETGYGEPILLGYMIERAPQTGILERTETAIPWASRFGTAVRWSHEPGEGA